MKPAENPSTNPWNCKIRKGSGVDEPSHHPKMLASRSKPTPSKWDDAQKWLVGLSSGGYHSNHTNHTKIEHRNSNADDRRLLGPIIENGRKSCSSNGVLNENVALAMAAQDKGETKEMIDKQDNGPMMSIRPVFLRDMATEMTPFESKEPSRAATPLGATTPVLRSSNGSRSSTPERLREGDRTLESYQTSMRGTETRRDDVLSGKMKRNLVLRTTKGEKELNGCKVFEGNCYEQVMDPNSLESRAMAWDVAERAKYFARYKREEMKLQAWENHEKRKAELEMRRMEVKAEKLKSRAHERLTSKLASTRRMAEEKRANAEAKLQDRASKASDRLEYIRRTGRMPVFFFPFGRLPSLCN